MKKTVLGTLIALSAALLSAPAAFAATDAQKAEAKAKYESMTPEQQANARAAAKEKWDAMTPEQQAEKKAAARARWNEMTPEQQAAAKKRHAERKAMRTGDAAKTPVAAAK